MGYLAWWRGQFEENLWIGLFLPCTFFHLALRANRVCLCFPIEITCLYSPDDSLIVRNINVEILFVKHDQAFQLLVF